jgi:ankyrin repeat protein
VQRIETLLSRNSIGADIKGDALVTAAGIGDLELVHLLIRWGADVNHRAEDGRTVLMIAATQGFSVQCGNDELVTSYRGNTEIVQALLNAGACLDDQDDKGNTALILAASHRRSASVQLLLDAGANANARNKHGWTALLCATNYNSDMTNLKEIVSALIAHGADLNVRDDKGKTALTHATGTTAIKEMLLRAGAIE